MGRGTQLAKHIVVFFYLEPGPDDTPDRLRVATRMFLDGDDVANLRDIILQLHALSREYSAMGPIQPHASNWQTGSSPCQGTPPTSGSG